MTDVGATTTRPPRIRRVGTPRRWAVLLNGRAKGWSGGVHQAVQRYVPGRDLFLTDDFRQAERTVDRLLLNPSARYEVIFTGGGDGTVVYLLNAIWRRVQEGRLAPEEAPPVGVLRLGTGNAIAHYLGAGDIITDLRALAAGRPLQVHDVDMIVGLSGERFPFAGFGWDADILNDYAVIKDGSRDTMFEPYVTGLGGYFAATFGRTVPRALRHRGHRVAVVALDEAYLVDQRGEVLEEVGAGAVLYEGPVVALGCSSIPFWGFKIRMFPLAGTWPGFAHLRAFDGRPTDVIFNLRHWWQGDIRAGRICDVLFRHVRVELLDRPLAYQVAGDAAGLEREVEWRVTERPHQLAVVHH